MTYSDCCGKGCGYQYKQFVCPGLEGLDKNTRKKCCALKNPCENKCYKKEDKKSSCKKYSYENEYKDCNQCNDCKQCKYDKCYYPSSTEGVYYANGKYYGHCNVLKGLDKNTKRDCCQLKKSCKCY